MQYIQSKQVYRKVLRADAKRRGIPILRTRCVDIDKGDNYRSRYLAMEFNTQKMNGLHASTHLKALKLWVFDAATRTSDTFKEELEEEEGGVGGGGGYRGERCRTSVFRSKAQLETRFEVKTKVVGKGEGEAIFLSRIIRVSTQG